MKLCFEGGIHDYGVFVDLGKVPGDVCCYQGELELCFEF